MRVVVHHPARTEPDGTEVPESVSAYRMSRIYDLPNPLTGETVPKDEVAATLVEQAQEEFPDLEVSIEYFHDHGDGTASWEPEPPATPAAPGAIHERELTATQDQAASGGAE